MENRSLSFYQVSTQVNQVQSSNNFVLF